MRKIFFIFLLFIIGFKAFAHNPQVSTISIIQNEEMKWSVFITAPLYTWQLALQANDPKIKLDSLNIVATQNLLLKLIKNNLIINGEKYISINKTKIQVGHESTIYFEINKTNLIAKVEFMAFDKLREHFTLLKIIANNGAKTNFILNSDNNFKYNIDNKVDYKYNEAFLKYIEIIYRIGIRYIILAGVSFILFYILFKRKLLYKKIQAVFPKNSDYIREFFFSITTILIFGIIIVNIMDNPHIRPYTKVYEDVNEKGWLYYFAAFPLMLIIHDSYFYWTHRMMHHKSIFNTFHLVHHKSTNPSPWAAYAFHPLEAVVENGIFIVFAFSFPLHKSHTPIFFLFSVIYNIYGHLGWELFPQGFNKSLLGRWINTSVCHNQHHKYFKGNYGLYLLFWDRIMGTLRTDYDDAYEEIKGRKK